MYNIKKTTIAACLLLIGSVAYGQTSRSNPALDSLKAIQNPQELNRKLKSLGNGTENDMILLINYYSKSEIISDSITREGLRKYPMGRIAMNTRYNAAYNEENPIAQEKSYLALKDDYPREDFGQIAYVLAYNFANKKNGNKALEYTLQATGRSKIGALSNIPAIVGAYDPKLAEKFIDKELGSPTQSKEERLPLLRIKSEILTANGDYIKAYDALKEYYEQTSRKTPDLTAKYYYLMSKNGNYQESFPFLEKAVSEGIGGEDVKSELIIAYQKLNPGQDANNYVANLDRIYQTKYKAEMIAKMTDKAAPDFTVQDDKGKTVSLSDFKGKIIILDFWATWCGPCKRSLPAMQMAVDKYKADPNVKFLFIHTWEQVADPTADAKKYLKDNNFDLPLYMDLRDINKINPAVSAFNVEGIPAKFIIDGNGRIRFRMDGFGGTNEAAVNEITTMIELSRKAG